METRAEPSSGHQAGAAAPLSRLAPRRLSSALLAGGLQRHTPERRLLVFLAFYRYLSFAAAVALMALLPSARGLPPSLGNNIALALVGIHVVSRILYPPSARAATAAGYIGLVVDIAVVLASVLATGGMNSGLLLYSLTPVLTASMLWEEKVALSAAGASVMALLGAHLADGRWGWILSGNNLVLFLLYGTAAFLLAVVPSRTNLNLWRRLREEATTQERQRLRRQLHSDLAQDVALLSLKSRELSNAVGAPSTQDAAQSAAEELQKAIQKTYRRVRAYLDILSLPSPVSPQESLKRLAEDFSSHSGVPVDLVLPEGPLPLSTVEETELLAIAQEAFSNIERHAQARRARLALTSSPAGVELMIEDDGQGFEIAEGGMPGHYGLTDMRNRAHEIGATFAITSAPGAGARVQVALPR